VTGCTASRWASCVSAFVTPGAIRAASVRNMVPFTEFLYGPKSAALSCGLS